MQEFVLKAWDNGGNRVSAPHCQLEYPGYPGICTPAVGQWENRAPSHQLSPARGCEAILGVQSLGGQELCIPSPCCVTLLLKKPYPSLEVSIFCGANLKTAQIFGQGQQHRPD